MMTFYSSDCYHIVVYCMLWMLQTAGVVFEIIILLGLTCVSFKVFYQKLKSMLNHLLQMSYDTTMMIAQ